MFYHLFADNEDDLSRCAWNSDEAVLVESVLVKSKQIFRQQDNADNDHATKGELAFDAVIAFYVSAILLVLNYHGRSL